MVVSGDSLYSISDRYNVRVNELANVNGMNVRTEVYIDQRLLIPTPKAPVGLHLPAIRKNPGPPKVRPLSALSPELVAYMDSRSGKFAGAIFEPQSGTMYVHEPRETFVAASTMKIPIMLTLLSRENNQDAGIVGTREPLLVPMLVVSDNEAATALFKKAGGQDAVQTEMRARGLTNTRVESDQWGLSTTTAPDMTRLMRSLYFGQRLNPALRRSALGLLGSVVEPQRWGVPAGVPDSTFIAFKGGWLERGDGWQVHQVGVMETDGRTFVFALMTAGQPGEVYGRESLEGAGKILGRLPRQL
ncbi:MAG: serine hydrolase [Chloroflexota bacterium]|nr:serine hydrolase [Chloroflexota bacterium]